jgi:hypothetical protein
MSLHIGGVQLVGGGWWGTRVVAYNSTYTFRSHNKYSYPLTKILCETHKLTHLSLGGSLDFTWHLKQAMTSEVNVLRGCP